MELITINHQLPQTIDDLAKFVLIGRDRMAAVRAEINAINRLGLAQEVRQQKLAEAQQISEVVLDAEVKLGELIAAMPTKQGERTDKQHSNNVVTKLGALKEIGFDKMQANRLETMAKHPEIVAQAKAEAREADDIVSRSFVLEKIKAKEQQEKTETVRAEIERQRGEIANSPAYALSGDFDVVAIDPPWNYGTQYDAAGRRVGNPYPEMPQEELLNINIPSSENCIMFLWTTQRFIWDAKQLLEHWGFEYRNIIVWDKQKIGMGDLFRMQCEFCLVGIKGKPLLDNNHTYRDIIQEPRREHSRKPDAFYEMVDALCVGRKLDYFGRQQRNGWVTYGNDTDKF